MNQHATQLKQFRQEVYQNFNKRADTLMDLLDALSSNTNGQSVVELSLNPAFRREYSSLFTALDEWEPEQGAKTLAQLAGPYLPAPSQQPFWLLGCDVTPQPRMHAAALEDRSYVYQPNQIQSNKPVTIGHAYSTVVLFPEEEPAHAPVWVVPLAVQRIGSRDDKELVGAEQMATLLEDKTLPFRQALCVEVVDSSYSKAAYLAHNREKDNLVTIARARSTRTFYRALPDRIEEENPPAVGHPTWYGDPLDLSDPTTWSAPDEITSDQFTSLSGKTYQVQLQSWHNLLMKGERKPVVLPMQCYPFTLVRIRLFHPNGELAFQNTLWLIVMGKRRAEFSLLHIFSAYQRRYDLEHFFRFGKQRLLLTHYQTPDTQREEKWWWLVHLAYLQLWMARPLAQAVPRPWEAPLPDAASRSLSATQVQRDFARIIRLSGTPASAPKRRGYSPGRRQGTIFPRRPRLPVVYKGKNDG